MRDAGWALPAAVARARLPHRRPAPMPQLPGPQLVHYRTRQWWRCRFGSTKKATLWFGLRSDPNFFSCWASISFNNLFFKSNFLGRKLISFTSFTLSYKTNLMEIWEPFNVIKNNSCAESLACWVIGKDSFCRRREWISSDSLKAEPHEMYMIQSFVYLLLLPLLSLVGALIDGESSVSSWPAPNRAATPVPKPLGARKPSPSSSTKRSAAFTSFLFFLFSSLVRYSVVGSVFVPVTPTHSIHV